MKSSSPRLQKINDELRKEAAEIIRSELKDPRVGAMTTVTSAQTTSDLKQCKIFVSILGDAQAKKAAMAGLKNSAPYMRKMLAKRVNLRNTPEITFVLDESLEYGMKMDRLFKDMAGEQHE
ncbi:MAG: 30S ribosome-binding factor RbfA [Defluviitaleaceae bacterium]|nr:30S ribosome-binding factor RbfA [Defluviitaleaceae bacterium]